MNTLTSAPKTIALAILALSAGLCFGADPLRHAAPHYASLTMTAGEALQLGFVNYGMATRAACETRLARMAETLLKNCPACRITHRGCLTELPARLQRALSEEPLDTPSARLPDGVVTYASTTAGLALASCRESEQQSAKAGAEQRVRCFASATRRPR